MSDDVHGRVLAELAAMPGLLVDSDELRPEHRLREDLGLESVTLIQLIVAIEDAFDIEFPDQFLNRKSFASISAIEQTITSILKDNEAA